MTAARGFEPSAYEDQVTQAFNFAVKQSNELKELKTHLAAAQKEKKEAYKRGLEMAAEIAEKEPLKHNEPYPGQEKMHFIGGLVNFQWAGKTIAEAIRAEGEKS